MIGIDSTPRWVCTGESRYLKTSRRMQMMSSAGFTYSSWETTQVLQQKWVEVQRVFSTASDHSFDQVLREEWRDIPTVTE